jgi:hypothetical protein
MALRGTLKDFGIADIFQLIGHQQKTGILTVKNRDQNVKIYFSEGNIVRAESATRKQRDLLGAMLVRAEVISENELHKALATQASTLKRLGEILLEQTSMDRSTLKSFAKLQTTETIYRLFLWDAGTYEFETTAVPVDDPADVVRSEAVLMEGFRQLDEWPAIRRKVTSYSARFQRLEELDAVLAKAAEDAGKDDGGGEDPFGELDLGADDGPKKPKDPRLKNIGDTERFVYSLITADRDVQKIIDLARLGEFETCKALVNLMDAHIIDLGTATESKAASAAPTVGGITSGRPHWMRIGLRAAVIASVVIAVGVAVWRLGSELDRLISPQVDRGYQDVGLQQVLARGQMQRLTRALELYRLSKGDYPPSLAALVEAGLLRPADTQFPWQQPYFYAKREGGYELLRPLY